MEMIGSSHSFEISSYPPCLTLTMASTSLLVPLAISFFFLLPNSPHATSFSIDLIHRDSPRSPFYNLSDSLSDRMSRAIRRSNSRMDYFQSTISTTSTDISSNVLPNGGSYLMTISLGTPPVQFLAIADTGSDLIWTQCSPCESCYDQDAPLFDPTKSSTYGDLSCDSSLCLALPRSSCDLLDRSCQYSYSYGDKSYTQGVLASETLGLSGSEFPKIAFGCGYNNDGTFNSRDAGLVGLGGGSLSLISQLSSSIGGKFAYCLVPHAMKIASSRLDFGDSAAVSGNGVVSTPLISRQEHKTYFFVTLQKITVGTNSISLPQEAQGNIIIDSGTTLTYLPTSVYQELLSALKNAINLQPVQDPSQSGLELCYQSGTGSNIPDMKFGFDGAEVVLGFLNTFIQVDQNVACAAFGPSQSLSIYGNVAQQNFKIGYDLPNMKVAFQPTDCTKN